MLLDTDPYHYVLLAHDPIRQNEYHFENFFSEREVERHSILVIGTQTRRDTRRYSSQSSLPSKSKAHSLETSIDIDIRLITHRNTFFFYPLVIG